MAKVIIFSGAGISAESGISTFRDSGGLWDNYKIEDICTAGCMQTNRDETIEFYDKRRADIADKKPNKAHLKIKELQDRYGSDIKIITQNVDDMFERAGCKDVLHLHGFLREIYCESCGFLKDIGYKKQRDAYNLCPACKKDALRPNIVFFGEMAPKYQDLQNELQDCEFIAIIGTSGNVIGVNSLVAFVDYAILNNLEPSPMIEEELFDKVIYDKASIAIDEIALAIEKFLG